MKRIVRKSFFLVFCGFSILSFGQSQKPVMDESKKLGEAKKSEIFQAEFIGERHPVSADLDWIPTLTHKVTKVDHGLPGEEEMLLRKAEKTAQKRDERAGETEDDDIILNPSTPVVSSEFNGNPNNGSSPMDNSIAVSNDGIIVSVANTTIQYRNEAGVLLFASSLTSFIDDPSIINTCDPLIHYDPQADRFIFFAQECSGNSSNSYLLVMFSQTNDPTDGWNYYKLTGNPLNDGSWFDYPKMAVSENELIITGNLFSNAGYYNESVVYQMEKNDGYAGESLTWQYWSDISGSPFTLLPVSSGSDVNYGPGIYLVATTSFGASHIKLYDLTDDIAGSPSLNYYSVPTPSYDVAGDAFQAGTSCDLQMGDCRALSGFYMNGIIHFVFHSEVSGGWNGINYNRLTVADLSNESNMFEDAGSNDFAYPSVSWFGLSPVDRSVVIGFGSVNSTIFPEIRAVHCNDAGDWSESTLVKSSSGYVSFTSFTRERWGDYTGTYRKHGTDQPVVWMNGMYGSTTHRWNTWIAEIEGQYFSGVEEAEENTAELSIAPNPVFETFVLKFNMEETMPISINVVGVDGKIVKQLYTGTAHQGANEFAFNKANLASGTYFVQVAGTDKQIANEKVIIN